jgi:hypothetical protein
MSRVSIIKIILCFFLIIISECVPASSSEYLAESNHPYQNNYEDTWPLKEPGASQIRLHFNYLKLAKNEFWGSGDELILLDKHGNELKTYVNYDEGINDQDFWTNWYEGDTLQVKLVTDSSRICDGFIIDKTDVKQGEGVTSDSSVESNYLAESDHPYQNNYEDTWPIKEPGAAQIRLHFNYLKLAKNEFWGSGDKLILLDKYGNELKTYVNYDEGINNQDLWTDWYPGDTLQVKLVTDSSRICDGFIIDKMETRPDETNSSSENIGNSKSPVSEVPSDVTGTGENKVLTATELTSSDNPSEFRQSVTLTAKVDTPSQATEKPSGTVTFMDGTTSIGIRDLTSGRATLTTSSLSAGTHSITAEYSGYNNFKSSTSSSFPLTVQDDNFNPSDRPDYTLIAAIIGAIGTIIAAIIAAIIGKRSKSN